VLQHGVFGDKTSFPVKTLLEVRKHTPFRLSNDSIFDFANIVFRPRDMDTRPMRYLAQARKFSHG